VLASSFSESMAKNHPDLITKEVTHIIEKKLEFFRENMVIRPMSEWKREDIYKVVIFCERLEQLEAAREVFEQDFDFCAKHMDYLGFVNGELINRKFDKGQGILKICQTLGVPIEDTYGFGDGQNDFSMMQVVGTSVCMENGEEDLKKICDYICPSVEEDGIAKAFAKLGLCE
ncbi:MAG: HAD hydrolase family protein, partial [Dorea sp.]|nr:HAD hydrolase family protein [Dorea sp.]